MSSGNVYMHRHVWLFMVLCDELSISPKLIMDTFYLILSNWCYKVCNIFSHSERISLYAIMLISAEIRMYENPHVLIQMMYKTYSTHSNTHNCTYGRTSQSQKRKRKRKRNRRKRSGAADTPTPHSMEGEQEENSANLFFKPTPRTHLYISLK